MSRARRYADHDRALLLRAAKLARLPGVTRAQACARFGLSIGALRRALKELALESIPSRKELLLGVLTEAGGRREGEIGSLTTLASYLDYVNKDGSTPEQVAGLLEELAAEGALEVRGGRFRLLREFP